MATIAALVGEMFEDAEYTQPAEAFRAAGHTVVTVGIEAGSEVRGERGKAAVRVERAAGDVSVKDFDALFIPGGVSPDKLRVDADVVQFAREFVLGGKPVFIICHAPQLLITAQVLAGRKVAGWRSIVQDIKNAGATFVDEPAVKDGNLISSRSPKDIPQFIEASLALLNEVYGTPEAAGVSRRPG